MASLQQQHQKNCALGKRLLKLDTPGCTCKPTYITVVHTGEGGRKRVGTNRKDALRELTRLQRDQDQGTVVTKPNVTFKQQSSEWLAAHTGKETSLLLIETTLKYADKTFGNKKVRDLRTSDVERFLETIRKSRKNGKPVSDGTLSKHLRNLHACLEWARKSGYVQQNVVALMHDSTRPRRSDPNLAYFTNAELAKLWTVTPADDSPTELTKAHIFKTLVTTGIRVGEAVALTWGDVKLLDAELRITKSFSEKRGRDKQLIGVQPTKNREHRTVDLTADARKVIEAWFTTAQRLGYSVAPDALVFPQSGGSGKKRGGYWMSTNLLKRFYGAMDRAGIPLVGEEGNKRKLHSLRNTYARIALENKATLDWVSTQLGHSSITTTRNYYGRWSREAEKKMAASLDGAFSI